ncbi:MAG: phosphoglycerate kinase [Candidatus Moraniibacteriota bacterium]
MQPLKLKRIDELEVKGKKVLVRIDANVEIDEKGDVREKYKIESAKQTVAYLVAQGAKVALVSHFGRPDGKVDEKFSVACLTDDVERALGVSVKFVDDCVSEAIPVELENLAENQVLLLENVRFYAEEETNDAGFAERLARPFEIFINEAFSVCHRDQASVTGITKFLPSGAGFHLLEEVRFLGEALQSPAHPAIAIIGGSKIETKIPVLKAFEAQYDFVLVGSKIADEAQAEGMSFSEKVMLPVDFAEGHLDIGAQTIELFVEKIQTAKTIVWNGPLGKFEESPYDTGTRAIVSSMAASDAVTIVGGGESVQTLEEWGCFGAMKFVSTGGGAMLDFLAGAPMPGLEALVLRV